MTDPKHVEVPEEAGEAAADFLSAWKFCPVSQATEPSRSCLDDAAKQFVEAAAPALRQQGAEQERERLLTRDDVERLGGIAGELEHLPAEVRRHFDQDGRDARFLRLLQQRFLAALDSEDD